MTGVSPDGDRAGRPADQAPAGLGDTATIPDAQNKPRLMKRCPKHKPELIDGLRGLYRCTSCGKRGRLSYGMPKFGRPRRMLWWTQ